MRTVTMDQAAPLTFADVAALADQYAAPVEDVLLIAVNLYGISSVHQRHRARVHVRLRGTPQVPWMVIVPLNATTSPFRLADDELSLGGELIGAIERIDADEAVGGYFRDGGRAATLNPNARSRCTGCAFCPNTLEAAADPRLAEERGLRELLSALGEQHPRGDLGELREVTVSTGCFEREDLALGHLAALRSALTSHGVSARIGILTSVIRSREAFEELRATAHPFVLRLTAECFTRRDLLLKASKAELDSVRMPQPVNMSSAMSRRATIWARLGLTIPVHSRWPGFEEITRHGRPAPDPGRVTELHALWRVFTALGLAVEPPPGERPSGLIRACRPVSPFASPSAGIATPTPRTSFGRPFRHEVLVRRTDSRIGPNSIRDRLPRRGTSAGVGASVDESLEPWLMRRLGPSCQVMVGGAIGWRS